MTTAMMIDTPPLAPRTERSSFSLLTRVEIRKAVDTRAGLWLLLCVAATAITGAVLRSATGSPLHHNFTDISNVVQEFTSILLPIVGILLITSEWSQRTALQTFTLVPQRWRVVRAKIAAGILIGLGAAVVSLVLAAVATAFASHPAGVSPWQSSLDVIGVGLLYQSLSLLGGMAFGLLLLNSPLAIVLNFALPIVWNILTGSISSLNGVANWLNVSNTAGNLLQNDMTPEHWAQLLVSALVWIGIPFAVGVLRLRRKEIA
jgi:ABC-2 type transport system permease protein